MTTSNQPVGLRAVVAMASVCLASAPALAVSYSETAVVSGGTLQYSGTAANVNQFKANNGSAFIVGSNLVLNHIAIVGANVTTNAAGTVFCNDVPGKIQGMSKVYYVYYAGYGLNNSAGYTQVISSIAPFAEGYPSAGLSFTFGTNNVANSKSAVFLGSYLTDAKNNMIPFVRRGDEVLLTTLGGYPGGVNNQPSIASHSAIYKNTNAPGTLNAGPFLQFPASADAMIADLYLDISNGGGSAFVTNPLLPAIVGPGCQLSEQFAPSNAQGYLFTTGIEYWQDVRVRLDSAGNVTTAGCTQPAVGNTYTLTVYYRGYVEPVHHMY